MQKGHVPAQQEVGFGGSEVDVCPGRADEGAGTVGMAVAGLGGGTGTSGVSQPAGREADMESQAGKF